MTKQQFFSIALCISLIACSHSLPKQPKHTLDFSITKSKLLEHFKIISSDLTKGRKVGSPGSEFVQEYIAHSLHCNNVSPFNNGYKHQFYLKESLISKAKFGTNIVGLIPSKINSKEYIVLTAHYDHLGMKGRRIFNGADDNASGTSALLAVANKMASQSLNHNVLIIFTDSEENNLKGIKAFLEQNSELVSKIKLNINMDMLAGSKQSKRLHFVSKNLDLLLSKDEIDEFNDNHFFTNFVIKQGFRREKHYLNRNVDWIKASDHYEFHKRNIPFIYYGVGTHKNYHTTNDIYENTNHNLLHQSANAIFNQIIYLDQTI